MDVEEKDRPGRGRSARKRAAHEVEAVAHELADLPEARWLKLPVSAELREEIQRARETGGHGARKRQIKHLAGELRRREEELEPLRAFLDGVHQTQLSENKAFHDLEALRDRLCDPQQFEAALPEVVSAFPDVDPAAIARLARAVQAGGDRRAFREIFRRLREGRREPAGS